MLIFSKYKYYVYDISIKISSTFHTLFTIKKAMKLFTKIIVYLYTTLGHSIKENRI